MASGTSSNGGRGGGGSNRTTIRDIAARAGVSAMTVSRVLRGAGVGSGSGRGASFGLGASSETARRVLDIAREMDYIAIRPALQNRKGTAQVVGVVFDGIDSVKGFVGSHTFEGLRDEAMRRGFDLLLHARSAGTSGASGISRASNGRDILRREEAAFLDRRSDGVIFISPRERRALLESLVSHGFPVVSCFSRDVPDGVATIAPDNDAAMQRAVGYLHGLGHRRIAFFAGPEWHSDARERRAAWAQAMQEVGLEDEAGRAGRVQSSQGETARHVAAAKRLLGAKPTAVVCHNDYRALLLDEAARARGLDVPRDLSIVGVDDTPEAQARGLSTMRLDFEEAGRQAVRSVIAMIEGQSAQSVSHRLDARLIERRSVASARSP